MEQLITRILMPGDHTHGELDWLVQTILIHPAAHWRSQLDLRDSENAGPSFLILKRLGYVMVTIVWTVALWIGQNHHTIAVLF